MKISIGNPVQGDDFFDREQEQKLLWRKLERNHILLLAPRRIGKTSLLLQMRHTAKDHGFNAALGSFAPCTDEFDCINNLLKAVSKNSNLNEKFWKKLKTKLERVKGVKLAGFQIALEDSDRSGWRQLGEELTKTLQELDGDWLICVDEMPVFILSLLKQEDGVNTAHNFLYWFRDLRQKHHSRIRWILAGSIGMDTVASRLGLGDTINDLDPFPLGAFTAETADNFLLKLAKNYDISLDGEIRQYMINLLGWPVPYYLQLLFDKLLEQRQVDSPVTRDLVDQAFATLLSPTYKMHFDYWRQRLHEELDSPDDEYSVVLLNAACRDPKGASRATLSQVLGKRISDVYKKDEKLVYLLDVLENDGYWVVQEGRYRFRLEWLRQYWKKRVAV